MTHAKERLAGAAVILFLTASLSAQVISPRVLIKGQVDTTDLRAFAEGIYRTAGARSPREKAEAIWRFFLTDGRFVAPGFWYHIAGWAYEEPGGEVLDPIKLLNSYGFGLCYQIAPLLQATYRAGGFEDARAWFLTGHTVTEVFYDGAYHYYDSDMLGYSVVGDGDPRILPVASVSQIARDPSIITGKLKSPTEVDGSKVDYPWYPGDLKEAAIGGLVELFTSTSDNWLFTGTRYPRGHSMEYVLRPGEKIIRYFEPEEPRVFYLPYSFDGEKWTEFPKEEPEYSIRTEDGPRSQKDGRRWATGRIEYTPVLSDADAFFRHDRNLRMADSRVGREYLSRESGSQSATAIFDVSSPWVLIDAAAAIETSISSRTARLESAISIDGGLSWLPMGTLAGPFQGKWEPEIPVMVRSDHGTLTSVAGKYSFLVRLQLLGGGGPDGVLVRKVEIVARFQHNPRTLPALTTGKNDLQYRTGESYRRAILLPLDQLDRWASRKTGIRHISEMGQDTLWPAAGGAGEVVLSLQAPASGTLAGFEVGARFLDLRDGLAPDKLTAETRRSQLAVTAAKLPRCASIGWSTSPAGPFKTLWEYRSTVLWRDGLEEEQLLRWPEVDQTVDLDGGVPMRLAAQRQKRVTQPPPTLPSGTKEVYVRYALQNMGMDSLRLAARIQPARRARPVEITHVWLSDGVRKEYKQRLTKPSDYQIDIPTSVPLVNQALILYCPTTAEPGGAVLPPLD